MLGKVTKSSTLAIALAAGLATAGMGLGADTAYAQAKKEKAAPANSPAFAAAAAPLQQKVDAAMAAQKKVEAGDAAAKAEVTAALAGAPAMLAQAERAAKTPLDKLVAGQFAMNIGIMTNDLTMAERGARAMIATGLLDPANTAKLQDVANKMAAARAAAGRPSEAGVRSALQQALNARQSAQGNDLALQLARDYPSPSSWRDAIRSVRQLSGYQGAENLDLMRLMMRAGAMSDRSDYLEYVDSAGPIRLPGEALKVMDAGTAAGKLTAADVRQARSMASGRVSADRASLAGAERDAKSANASGKTVQAAADAYLSYGQAAKAEELYNLALQKPGVDRNLVLTRLGIAQADQGKYAAAHANFSKITGQRAPLAKLWMLYLAQKDRSLASTGR